jgi:dTDP-4-amino-4,6-dideoxygalactose transaminase
MGDAAAFSFYGNKNMTTAEGGIVVSRHPDLLERVRNIRSHGMTTGTFQRAVSRRVGYDVTALGFNYRMDELRAAIGLAQLERLASWNERRAMLTHLYGEVFANRAVPVGIPFSREIAAGASSAHHIMPIVLPEHVDREAVIAALVEDGIQTTIHYPPVHSLSLYRERLGPIALPITDTFAERELTVPLHPRMQPDDVERVAVALKAALREADAELCSA